MGTFLRKKIQGFFSVSNDLIWRPKSTVNGVIREKKLWPSLILGILAFYVQSSMFVMGLMMIFDSYLNWSQNLLAMLLAIPLAFGLFNLFNVIINWLGHFIFGEKLDKKRTMLFSGFFLLPHIIGSIYREFITLLYVSIFELKKGLLPLFLYVSLVIIVELWKIIFPISMFKNIYVSSISKAILAFIIITAILLGTSMFHKPLDNDFIQSQFLTLSPQAEKAQLAGIDFGSVIVGSTYWFRNPIRGDLVAFIHDTESIVGRITAIPGQKVQLSDGILRVDDNVVRETYLTAKGTSTWGPKTLGEKEYLILPDNRQLEKVFIVDRGKVKGIMPSIFHKFIMWATNLVSEKAVGKYGELKVRLLNITDAQSMSVLVREISRALATEEPQKEVYYQSFWQDWFNDVIPGEKMTIIAEEVYLDEDLRIVGVIRLWKNPYIEDRWVIEGLETVSLEQKEKIISSMVDYGLGILERMNTENISVYVSNNDSQIISLLKNMGFVKYAVGAVNSYGDYQTCMSEYRRQK